MLEHPEQSRYLGNPEPPPRLHRAQIVIKGQVKATLQGEDVETLKARAHRYAVTQGWHRAAVVVSHVAP